MSNNDSTPQKQTRKSFFKKAGAATLTLTGFPYVVSKGSTPYMNLKPESPQSTGSDRLNLASYSENITFNVPSDFSNLKEAMEALSTSKPRLGVRITINLETGYVLKHQIHVDGLDLSYITITSEDEIVTVSREAMTDRFAEDVVNQATVDDYDDPDMVQFVNRPVFGGDNGARLPVIDVLFQMDTSGTEYKGRTGFTALNGSIINIRPYKGINNCADTALIANQGSVISAVRGQFRNAGYERDASDREGSPNGVFLSGLLVFRSSNVVVRHADFSGAAADGVYMGSESVCDARGADFSYAGRFGCHVYGGGRLNIHGSKVMSAGNNNVVVYDNVEIGMRNAEISHATNTNVFGGNGCTIGATRSLITDAGSHNIRLENGCNIDLGFAQVRRSGEDNIHVSESKVTGVKVEATDAASVSIWSRASTVHLRECTISSDDIGILSEKSDIDLHQAVLTTAGPVMIARRGTTINAHGADITSEAGWAEVTEGSQIVLTSTDTVVGNTNVSSFNSIDGNNGIIWK